MEKKTELIEKYLTGEMSIKEQVEFEESLRNDPELRQEFFFRNDLDHAIKENDIIDLRDTLNDIADSIDLPEKKNHKIYIYSSVAAVLIFFIVIAGNYFNSVNKLNNQQIFENYYKVYPSISGYRSAGNSEVDQDLYLAFSYYDNYEFEDASVQFQKAIKSDKSNLMSRFYLAICLVETEKYREAEEHFVGLTIKQDHLFWEQSHWYLAMIYIKTGEMDKAKSVLNVIIQNNMSCTEDAKLLLRSIK